MFLHINQVLPPIIFLWDSFYTQFFVLPHFIDVVSTTFLYRRIPYSNTEPYGMCDAFERQRKNGIDRSAAEEIDIY